MKPLSMLTLVFIFAATQSYGDVGISRASAVFAIYSEDWRFSSAGVPQLILVLWPDDRAIWSENEIDGGPPYHSAHLPAGTFGRLVAGLVRDGRFDDKRLRQPYVAWDSRFTTILARHDGREMMMRWGADVNSTTEGYRHFRDVWDCIRRQAAALRAEKSEVVQGALISKHGVIAWSDQ